MKRNPEKEKKRNKATAYGGFAVRIFMAFVAFAVIFVFARHLTGMVTDHPYLYAGIFSVIALGVVFGDLYLYYKLNIRPFRTEKDQNTKNQV